MKPSFALLLLLIPFAGCRFGPFHVVKGNGDVQKQERSVSNFQSVEANGSFNVYLTQGSDYHLELEGESNLLPYITTRVEGSKLYIRTEHAIDLTTNQDLNIYVTMPKVVSVTLNGAGNIESKTTLTSTDPMAFSLNGSGNVKAAVDAPSVEASIAGAGAYYMSGQTRSVKVDIAGSGDFHGDQLKSEQGKVSIMGSGNAYIFSSVSLDVTIGGSGDVYYYGDPAVSSHVYGSGSLHKKS